MARSASPSFGQLAGDFAGACDATPCPAADATGSGGNAHRLPGFQPRAGLHPAAIDAHLPGAQKLLQVAEGEIGKMRLEPAVQAHAGLVRGDGSGFDACHDLECLEETST